MSHPLAPYGISVPEIEFLQQHRFNEIAQERLRKVMAQREEVLEAFIAKHGFEPDRFVQIEQRTASGLSEWSVRRRTDEEMAELSRKGAGLTGMRTIVIDILAGSDYA